MQVWPKKVTARIISVPLGRYSLPILHAYLDCYFVYYYYVNGMPRVSTYSGVMAGTLDNEEYSCERIHRK